jgi:hypothetical protein
LENQFKRAIRDAVNRPSRKPFTWGGLVGYRQLAVIADAVQRLVDDTEETAYLRQLLSQVTRALAHNRTLAEDLHAAHTWLRRIASVLQYRSPGVEEVVDASTSEEVATAMTKLLTEFQPDGKRQPAQSALYGVLCRTWNAYASDLLHCYDIPGLPPDNLALEALFSRLRRHQRRISGRKSTQELSVFGHYQILFLAQSEHELLQQLRTVPIPCYWRHRYRLHQAGAPRQFLHQLHRDPKHAVQRLIDAYLKRRHELVQTKIPDSLLPNTS